MNGKKSLLADRGRSLTSFYKGDISHSIPTRGEFSSPSLAYATSSHPA
jgi:hypothetical protein